MHDNKTKVKCGVDTCKYHDNHMCVANDIEVNIIGDSKAKSSDGTCCTTFINK